MPGGRRGRRGNDDFAEFDDPFFTSSFPGNSSGEEQIQSVSFQSSTVTYEDSSGSYYAKSSAKRAGTDGVTFEEKKEADSSGRASHLVSRGLHNKGHTVARNLNPDGRMETVQTLHNLNEDEIDGFEEEWKGKSEAPGSSRLTNDAEDIDHGGAPSNEHSQSKKDGKKKKKAKNEAKAPPNP